MQERQFAGEAGQRTPSWYLSRGDKQYGPLGDRELLLLAERGGLRKDDLLWKPGFEFLEAGRQRRQSRRAAGAGARATSRPRRSGIFRGR